MYLVANVFNSQAHNPTSARFAKKVPLRRVPLAPPLPDMLALSLTHMRASYLPPAHIGNSLLGLLLPL